MSITSDCPECLSTITELPDAGQILPELCAPCATLSQPATPILKQSITVYCLGEYLNNLVQQKYCHTGPKGCI